MPDGSGTFRQHLLPGVVVSWPSGSIDQAQRGVLAPIVLWHIRIGPVEEFAGGQQQRSYELKPDLLADHYRAVERASVGGSVNSSLKHCCVASIGR